MPKTSISMGVGLPLAHLRVARESVAARSRPSDRRSAEVNHGASGLRQAVPGHPSSHHHMPPAILIVDVGSQRHCQLRRDSHEALDESIVNFACNARSFGQHQREPPANLLEMQLV